MSALDTIMNKRLEQSPPVTATIMIERRDCNGRDDL